MKLLPFYAVGLANQRYLQVSSPSAVFRLDLQWVEWMPMPRYVIAFTSRDGNW